MEHLDPTCLMRWTGRQSIYLRRECEHLPRVLDSSPFIVGYLCRFQVSEVSRDPQEPPGSQETAGCQETLACQAGRARPLETKVRSFRGLKAKTCAPLACHLSLRLARACLRLDCVLMWSQSCCVLTKLDVLLMVNARGSVCCWLGGAQAVQAL